ncbi:MAG TPA: LacI family DNA-binding transcriptional regulator, partial [Spirochaetia bacterium]|nr:LacI family DNA-binding transcriptional regulator [Spirochaetia bacterium]
ARLAGVSKSTVSRVVADNGGNASVSSRARDAVMAAVQELGYTHNDVAAGLRTSRTNMIFLMVPDISNPFWSETARGVQDSCESNNYSVVMGSTDWREEREEKYLALAKSGRFDGAILNSVTADIDRFKSIGIPAVLIGERSRKTELDTVGTATYQAAMIALEYLLSRGHRRIAIATSKTGSERFLSRRYRAYIDFHRKHSLEVDPDLVFFVQLSAEGGQELVRRIVSLPRWRERVTAVFCGNDVLAIAALEALEASRIRPGRELSIIGMDDIPLAEMTKPPLTTIRKPRYEIGSKAAGLLMARIEEPQRKPEKHLFPGELIVRGSVADRKDME